MFAQGHNTAEVGIEPPDLSLRSLHCELKIQKLILHFFLLSDFFLFERQDNNSQRFRSALFTFFHWLNGIPTVSQRPSRSPAHSKRPAHEQPGVSKQRLLLVLITLLCRGDNSGDSCVDRLLLKVLRGHPAGQDHVLLDWGVQGLRVGS